MTEIYTKRFLRCPNGCDCEWSVEHLFGHHESAGPWACDECGEAWRLAIKGEAIEMTRAPKHDYGPRVVVVLEIPPQTEPIRFKLTKRRAAEFTDENERFLYEEHTCPTNWLGDVDEMYIGEDPDPHHIIRFVEARALTAEEEAKLEHGIGPVTLDGAPGHNLEREHKEQEAARRLN